jgi:hypothetical protein
MVPRVLRLQALDVFDRLWGPKHRLDVKLALRGAERDLPYAPHGIIGQSYDRDDLAVSGKQARPSRTCRYMPPAWHACARRTPSNHRTRRKTRGVALPPTGQ